jgi:hypothetical protein
MTDTATYTEETPIRSEVCDGAQRGRQASREASGAKGQAVLGFVVKATSTYGLKMWISRSRVGTHSVFGPRERAEVFRTRPDAHTAIQELPAAFAKAGFVFSVEPI